MVVLVLSEAVANGAVSREWAGLAHQSLQGPRDHPHGTVPLGLHLEHDTARSQVPPVPIQVLSALGFPDMGSFWD